MNRGPDQHPQNPSRFSSKFLGAISISRERYVLSRGRDLSIAGAIKCRGRDIVILGAIFGKVPKLLLNQTYTLGNLVI